VVAAAHGGFAVRGVEGFVGEKVVFAEEAGFVVPEFAHHCCASRGIVISGSKKMVRERVDEFWFMRRKKKLKSGGEFGGAGYHFQAGFPSAMPLIEGINSTYR
jgi:hypothetical protein